MGDVPKLTAADIAKRGHSAEMLTNRYVAAKRVFDEAKAELDLAKQHLMLILDGDDFDDFGVTVTTRGGGQTPDWEALTAKAVEVAGFQTWQGLLEHENLTLDQFMKRRVTSQVVKVSKERLEEHDPF